MERGKNRRKMLEGRVVSARMEKTAVVCVERRVRHPLYGKVIRRRSKFYAHDPGSICHEGDHVRIAETRPLSKTKRWRVVEILKRENA